MIRTRLAPLALSMAVLIACAAFAAATPLKLALVHIDLVDVRSGTIEPDVTVLIASDRIATVRLSRSNETLPEGTKIVDCRGKFLIPGLWDMHIHTDGDRRALAALVAHGITGARDMGGDVQKLAEARRQIDAGEWLGPRLFFAGPMLRGPEFAPGDDTWIIHSPDEARRAVAKLVGLHVDLIKVHDGLSRDSFFAIAQASREHKIPFAGHVPVSVTPIEASDAGQKSIEHLEFVPKPCLVLFDSPRPAPDKLPSGCDSQSLDALLLHLARNGTFLDPTIQSFRYFAPKQWAAIFAEFRNLVPLIRKNRVIILAGTDWSSFLDSKGDSPGTSLQDELSLLVEAGFKPVEALRAATLNPALFWARSKTTGMIASDEPASLIILNGNPLRRIENVRNVVAVISNGRYFDRRDLDQMLGQITRTN